MTNSEILTKAIEKAIANGWKPLPKSAPTEVMQWSGQGMVEVAILNENGRDGRWVRELEGIIFNHDFAKALWGEETNMVIVEDGGDMIGEAWKAHLQEMVIAPDPIKYLGANL